MHPLTAVQANSPQPPLLPTWQQAMHASLGLVHSTLQQFLRCARPGFLIRSR